MSPSNLLTPESTPPKHSSANPSLLPIDCSPKKSTVKHFPSLTNGSSSVDSELECIREEIELSVGKETKCNVESPTDSPRSSEAKVIKADDESTPKVNGACVKGARAKSKRSGRKRKSKKDKAITSSQVSTVNPSNQKPKSITQPKRLVLKSS